MLKLVVDAGVPALVFSAMVVGMELTADDFRRVARRPATVVAATAGQFLLLPAIGWLLVRSFRLQPAIAQGVLLVAACPSGAMANVSTYLTRGNVALSVTLTAVSCLAAALTTPLALAFLPAQDGESTGFPVPYGVLAGQLVLLLVLPALSGMGIRRRWQDITRRHGRTLLGFSIATLAALLGFIIVQEAEQFACALADLAAAAGVLTVLVQGVTSFVVSPPSEVFHAMGSPGPSPRHRGDHRRVRLPEQRTHNGPVIRPKSHRTLVLVFRRRLLPVYVVRRDRRRLRQAGIPRSNRTQGAEAGVVGR